MRHPFLHGTLAGPEDLTPEEMQRISQATGDALRDIRMAAVQLNGLPWALLGGQALISYGVPRTTQDLDVTTVLAGDLATILVRDFDWIPLKWDDDAEDFVEAEEVTQSEIDDPVLFDIGEVRIMFMLRSPKGAYVDLLSTQHPIEADMVNEASWRRVHGEMTPVAPLGGVLLVKTKADRSKDIAAIEQTAESLDATTLRSAVTWAARRDPGHAEDLEAIIDSVRARRRPKSSKPYKKL